MITIPQAETVEVGKAYILVDPRKKSQPRYGVIETPGNEKWFRCWGDSVHVERAIRNGLRFFGPLSLQGEQQ